MYLRGVIAILSIGIGEKQISIINSISNKRFTHLRL